MSANGLITIGQGQRFTAALHTREMQFKVERLTMSCQQGFKYTVTKIESAVRER